MQYKKIINFIMSDDPQLITLENYDHASLADPILTSPRSIEACQRLGIIPFDLVQKPIEVLQYIHRDVQMDEEGSCLWMM
jgi:hypothetical protein